MMSKGALAQQLLIAFVKSSAGEEFDLDDVPRVCYKMAERLDEIIRDHAPGGKAHLQKYIEHKP